MHSTAKLLESKTVGVCQSGESSIEGVGGFIFFSVKQNGLALSPFDKVNGESAFRFETLFA